MLRKSEERGVRREAGAVGGVGCWVLVLEIFFGGWKKMTLPCILWSDSSGLLSRNRLSPHSSSQQYQYLGSNIAGSDKLSGALNPVDEECESP